MKFQETLHLEIFLAIPFGITIITLLILIYLK
jgi:hypothetical protein